MNVIKRDGTIQPYSFDKIQNAVTKAFDSVNEPVTEKFITQLKDVIQPYIVADKDLTVEEIQDIIQKQLIKKNKYEVVEAFILYRKEREEERVEKLKLIKDINKALKASDIQNQNANVDEASFGGRVGEAARVITKDRALKHMNKVSRKNHEDNMVYIHDLDSWETGMHNCLSVPYDTLLANGVKTRQVDIRPAGSVNTAMQLVAVYFQLQSLQQFGGVSATHIDWTMVPYVRKSFLKHYNDVRDTLWMKPLAVDNVNETSIKNTTYVGKWYSFIKKYVYKKAIVRLKKEIHQSVEALYHNLNSLQSRSGNQLPFTSINYGTCTWDEGRLITSALLDVSIEGLGIHHQTSIFPCGIFQCKTGINRKPGDPNYDLFCKALYSTAKRIYPNYANCDWSNQQAWKRKDIETRKKVIAELSNVERDILYNKSDEILYALGLNRMSDATRWEPNGAGGIIHTVSVCELERPYEIFSTMGCRTANGYDVNFENSYRKNIQSVIKTGELYDDYLSGAQKDGRGNICPVTVILPTIAMEAKIKSEKTGKNVIDTFMNMLNKKIGEAKDTLIERFNHIASQSPDAARFMWENNTMSGLVPEEGIVSALKHGTLALGQLGLAECLQILIGENQCTLKGMDLAKKIEALFELRCNEYKAKYQLNFGVYYTPAENLCYTAMKKFKSKYGIIPNVSDKEYFTNSIHVPVYEDVDVFEKINIESELTGYSSAGCITYAELPSTAINNIEAVEEIVNYAMDKDIPYFALNFPLDTCNNCKYQGDFNGVCPECGSTDIDELRRVTGYLSTTKKHFNKGKQAETDARVKHTDKMI